MDFPGRIQKVQHNTLEVNSRAIIIQNKKKKRVYHLSVELGDIPD
jgi:hypothetical protein